MSMYRIFNKSSEEMDEIQNGEIDLIVTSPPFGVGLQYGKFQDVHTLKDYKKFLSVVAGECCRVLSPAGLFVAEMADTSVCDGNFVHLAELFVSICCRESGLNLIERHINLMDIGVHGEIHTPVESHGNHSNCLHWMVFGKDSSREFKFGKFYHLSYPDHREQTGNHPCPFPLEIIDQLLEIGQFCKGKRVLDPFMGTGELGCEVLRRGGNFLGYETEEVYFSEAENKLKSALNY